MYGIIKYFSENLLSLIWLFVIVTLIVSYFLGKKKMKEEKELIEIELKKKDINAPKTNHKFMQGEKIEKQKLSINNRIEETMNNNAIILSAGMGKRMNNEIPKGAIKLLGKEMVLYPVEVLEQLNFNKITVVVGYKKEVIYDILKGHNVEFATQTELNGTAKACLAAKDNFIGVTGNIIILPCDMPLLSTELVKETFRFHELNSNDLTVLSSEVDNPFSYGRIVRDGKGNFLKITEEADCTDEMRKIKEINSSVYCVSANLLFKYLEKIENHNKKNEYYLTDIVELMKKDNLKVEAYKYPNSFEITGINTLEALEDAEIKELERRKK